MGLALAGGAALAAGVLLGRRRTGTPAPAAAARASTRLYAGAAVLSFSVLADSAMEHYRGLYFRRLMYVAPAMAALTLGTSLGATAGPPQPEGPARDAVYAAAVAAGVVGTGFHLYNIGKREGGFDLLNFFYAAPIGAPAALGLAGLFGLAAGRLATPPPRILGLPAAPTLAGLSAVAMLGTVGEAGLLHFRGAFQDPFMYLPVTLPPAAALALAAAAALAGIPAARRVAAALLRATQLLGLLGSGFHAYGIHRNMGGWRNWSQMIFQGPPLPAPPGFTGVACGGLAALALYEAATEGRP
ncbi:MAG TPA: hypothetical protein VE993_21530 [Stellaceae bacterium]|nr:hypothetical protein [Stellaceae bacterium]